MRHSHRTRTHSARRAVFALAIVTAALAVGAEAQVARASTRAPQARTRCGSESCRDTTERLVARIDSLRNEFNFRRMSPAQRDTLAVELQRAMLAFQQFVEADMRADFERARARDEIVARTLDSVRAGAMPRAAPRGGAMTFVVPQAAPHGYLGVVFDGPMYEDVTPTARWVRFLTHPRIASVDPASPAERAGVAVGDTVMAFNGTDVLERTISFTKLLVPDSAVMVTVRRDGGEKELKVVVAVQPSFMARRAPVIVPRADGSGYTFVTPGAPPARVRIALPQGDETPAAPMAVWGSNQAIAGARLETINEGVGKALGRSEGVFVLSVTPGSPAHQSGLRDGDIILRAGDAKVTSVRELRRLVDRGDAERGVKLRIVRDKKERDLTLHWNR